MALQVGDRLGHYDVTARHRRGAKGGRAVRSFEWLAGPPGRRGAAAYVLSKSTRSHALRRLRDEWRSLRSALASIWRIRSRVTVKSRPTSSRVCSLPFPIPEPHFEHFRFAGCQGPQHVLDLLLEVESDHGVGCARAA